MRVAVTGSTGRLGRALVSALEDAPFSGPAGPCAWTRADLDLDAPAGVATALDRDRPEVVIHAAAWTDVDGCARDPDLAMRRNGHATDVLADACATRGVDLVMISTNEVFDGGRTDRMPYLATDVPSPANPYGASKLAGERAAVDRFATVGPVSGGRPGILGIVRTAWLFGPPGADFPHKILAAAARASADGTTLRVVGDEWGTPTSAADVAETICELLAEDAHAGIHHLVNTGIATRADWARDILTRVGLGVALEEVPAATWPRASKAPRWGVLAPTALPSGVPMRPWTEAMADYAPILRRGSPR